MTSSHRPTFYPAIGGPSQGGNLFTIQSSHVCARDKTVARQLKRRRIQQEGEEERPFLFVSVADFDEDIQRFVGDDADHVPRFRAGPEIKKRTTPDKENSLEPAEDESTNVPLSESLPATDGSPSGDEGSAEVKDEEKDDDDDVEDSSSDDEDDEEDEELALQIELDQIRKEREREEALRKVKEEEESILNKIARPDNSFEIKLSWEEEAVFRGPDKEIRPSKPSFINDSIRSEFYKRFIHKYIM